MWHLYLSRLNIAKRRTGATYAPRCLALRREPASSALFLRLALVHLAEQHDPVDDDCVMNRLGHILHVRLTHMVLPRVPVAALSNRLCLFRSLDDLCLRACLPSIHCSSGTPALAALATNLLWPTALIAHW
jgi:hypothetical protein